MDIDKKLRELKSERTPFCLATVVRVEGSAPRAAGAKMIITADKTFGTVGGGGVEHMAIKDARKTLRTKKATCEKYNLTEDGIQPCGGMMEIFLEPIAPQRRVMVFGAGHIAEKLIPMLSELDFEITLIDEREDRISLPAFSIADELSEELPDKYLVRCKFDDELSLIVLTHKHIHDEGIVEFCLDKPYRYLGLISSRKKWELFCKHYREKGFSDEQMERVSTPIGLDIGAATPFEIAVAIIAELIQLSEKPEDFKDGIGHFEK